MFDTRFKKFIDSKEYTFIPVFLDPSVSIIEQTQVSPETTISLNTINSIL
ncbi:MAG: hypothetical protein H6765_03255 [Candidatus Peribacteria bacterium]|nr:MAG: hypothetical protein H6765_03255 [Candidatus Peribacteria bacterium]